MCGLFIICVPGMSGAGEAKSADQTVSELLDIIYSNDPLTKDMEMRFFPALHNDVRACLRATKTYSESESPILEYLRSERNKLFKTEHREEIAVFSTSHVLGKVGDVSSNAFVFAMVRWDKRSATPPALIVMFVFDSMDEGVILSGPDFMEAHETISLFDAAMQYRDQKSKN